MKNNTIYICISALLTLVGSAHAQQKEYFRANVDNSHIVVAPLITTTWGQGNPYNLLCSNKETILTTDTADYGKHKTGCVATAMAQIMNYWKYPTRPTGKLTEDKGYLKIGVGTKVEKQTSTTINANGIIAVAQSTGGTTLNKQEYTYDYSDYPYNTEGERVWSPYYEYEYEWELLKDNYTEGDISDKSVLLVSRLMSDIGRSVDMVYGKDGSSAKLEAVSTSLTQYFGYSETAEYINAYNEDVYPFEKFVATLKNELDNHRPVIYSSQFNSQTKNPPHCYICDGYTDDGYFHFNFGESGEYDGWYLLSGEESDKYDFYPSYRNKTSLEIVIGIEP